MASFISLYSGSSGNCALMGEGGRWLCVDMGRSCKSTVAAMQSVGVDPASLCGLLVTHEHVDHVSGLRVFLKKYDIPVYGSAGTLDFLAQNGLVPETARLNPIDTDPFELNGFEVQSFHTSHDAADCRGFRMTAPSGRICAMATDLGIVTDEVLNGLYGADLTVLEANYDPVMLKFGPYPYPLKQRIASEVGHLCNNDTGEALVKMLEGGCTKFALCHLSKENNTPERALITVSNAFVSGGALPGKDGSLTALHRFEVTPAIEF